MREIAHVSDAIRPRVRVRLLPESSRLAPRVVALRDLAPASLCRVMRAEDVAALVA
jgi:hypothetical protein